MDMEEVAARVEIQHLLSTYNVYGDRRGYRDQFGSIWTEDAVIVIPGNQRSEGREKIVERFYGPRDAPPPSAAVEPAARPRSAVTFLRHNLTSCLIEFTDKQNATGRTYFMVVTDCGLDHTGVYTDEYRKENGRWLIAYRDVRLDYIADNALYAAGMREAMAADKAAARRK